MLKLDRSRLVNEDALLNIQFIDVTADVLKLERSRPVNKDPL